MVDVVVIDDHDMVAESLAASLGAEPGIDVVGVARTGAAGIDLVVTTGAEVALVDFRLPDMTGSDVVRGVTQRAPSCRCVVLTGTGQDRALLDAMEAGAVGFLTKDQRFDDVVEAVLAAAAGEVRFPPAMLARVLPELRRDPAAKTRLSRRERDVLELMAAGKGNSEIGETLFISINTVRTHVANVLMKLGAKSRGEAVAAAIREGLVDPGS